MFGLIFEDFFLQRNSAKSKNQNALVVCQKPFAHTKGQKRKFCLHTSNCTPIQNIRIKWRHLTMTNKLRSAFAVVFASGREVTGAEKYFTSVSKVEKEHVNFDAGRWQRDTDRKQLFPVTYFLCLIKCFSSGIVSLLGKSTIHEVPAVTTWKSLGFVVELIVQLLLVLAWKLLCCVPLTSGKWFQHSTAEFQVPFDFFTQKACEAGWKTIFHAPQKQRKKANTTSFF